MTYVELTGEMALGRRDGHVLMFNMAASGGGGFKRDLHGTLLIGMDQVLSSSLLLSSLELSDTTIYEPYVRALLGIASHFCEAVVLKLRDCTKRNLHGTLLIGTVQVRQHAELSDAKVYEP